MYGLFSGPKKNGRIIDVAVKRGSTVFILHWVKWIISQAIAWRRPGNCPTTASIFCFLCSHSLLFFTAAHFHLAGRWHFSFSHRRFEFPCFSSYEIPLLSSFSVSLSKSPGGHVISFQVKPWVAFGLPYLLIELLYIGMPVVRTDGCLLAWFTVTWLLFLGWVDYHISLAMGLRTRAALRTTRGAPL